MKRQNRLRWARKFCYANLYRNAFGTLRKLDRQPAKQGQQKENISSINFLIVKSLFELLRRDYQEEFDDNEVG